MKSHGWITLASRPLMLAKITKVDKTFAYSQIKSFRHLLCPALPLIFFQITLRKMLDNILKYEWPVLLCQWLILLHYAAQPKGQLISKHIFCIFNSPKKRTKKFNSTTMEPQVELFLFVFCENCRHQKDISKLTDI